MWGQTILAMRRQPMADIIERRYKNTLRYAADLRTALEGVVKAYNSMVAMGGVDEAVYALFPSGDRMQPTFRRRFRAVMHYAQEILKQMEVNEQIREISNG